MIYERSIKDFFNIAFYLVLLEINPGLIINLKIFNRELPSHDQYMQVVRAILHQYPHLLTQDYSSKRKNAKSIKKEWTFASNDVEVSNFLTM